MSPACELTIAVNDRIARCETAQALCVLARFVAHGLMLAPEGSRPTARALFITLVDEALTDLAIGDPVGRA